MPDPRARSEEWQVYALTLGAVSSRLNVASHSIQAFRVGKLAILAAAPRTLPLEAALRDQHAVVLELAEHFDPILPVRFGARMTAARIEQVVSPSAEILTNALEHVRGRQQLTIRLTGPAARVLDRSGSGTEYLARRLAASTFPDAALPLRNALSPFIVDERIQPGRGGVRLTVFHLVQKQAVADYIEAADAASGTIRPWHMSLTGPWPPFAFAPELSS